MSSLQFEPFMLPILYKSSGETTSKQGGSFFKSYKESVYGHSLQDHTSYHDKTYGLVAIR